MIPGLKLEITQVNIWTPASSLFLNYRKSDITEEKSTNLIFISCTFSSGIEYRKE